MINDIITIELTPFGGEGVAEVAMPTFRKQREMKNAISRCMNTRIEGGEGKMDTANIADVEIIRTLAFVRSAPFPTELEGFMDYCDTLDAKRLGAAEEMFMALSDAVRTVEGSPGPLGN